MKVTFPASSTSKPKNNRAWKRESLSFNLITIGIAFHQLTYTEKTMIYICKAGLCNNSTVGLLLVADKIFSKDSFKYSKVYHEQIYQMSNFSELQIIKANKNLITIRS